MLRGLVRGLSDRAKRIGHASGGFKAYHHLRNDRWLTVLCMHRVLPPNDPRYAEADKEWTITPKHLADTVTFVKRHFNVIALDELLDARRRGGPLPPRPLLLTFDDGWADNEEYAAPLLDAAKVPAVVFVTSDVVERKAPCWFDVLRMAHDGGRLDEESWREIWAGVGRTAPAERNKRQVEELLVVMAAMTQAEREKILAPCRPRLEDGRQHMVTSKQLRRLRTRGFAIGAHGRTHQPLDRCENLVDELVEPRRRLEEITGAPVTTLALPHSRFTPEVLREAERAGYELVFTGAPELTPSQNVPFTIGRAAIISRYLEDKRGEIRGDRLATNLFRRRHLATDRPVFTGDAPFVP